MKRDTLGWTDPGSRTHGARTRDFMMMTVTSSEFSWGRRDARDSESWDSLERANAELGAGTDGVRVSPRDTGREARSCWWTQLEALNSLKLCKQAVCTDCRRKQSFSGGGKGGFGSEWRTGRTVVGVPLSAKPLMD